MLSIVLILVGLFAAAVIGTILIRLVLSLRSMPVTIKTHNQITLVIDREIFNRKIDYDMEIRGFCSFMKKASCDQTLGARASVYLLSKHLTTTLRGERTSYNGLTLSKDRAGVYVESKDTELKDTALFYEIFNLMMWNKFGYNVAMTEGNLENAKRFMSEEEAKLNIEKRKDYDEAYRLWKARV